MMDGWRHGAEDTGDKHVTRVLKMHLLHWIEKLNCTVPGASILEGWVGREPPDFGQWGRRGIVGSWTGREILLYLIMYSK